MVPDQTTAGQHIHASLCLAMDIAQRIAHFETMVRPEADPTNDMAWFSLGSAYSQAGRHSDAAQAFIRCYELNKDMSKAYQLAGQALATAGENAKAIEVLTAGFVVAGQKGDRMPQNAMGELLKKLGAPVPEVAAKPEPAPIIVGADQIVCRKTGRPGNRMPRPPFKGPVGEWIRANIAQETFTAWIAQGTKVINELRLDLSREQDAETYDRHMREYLGIDEELLASLSAPK